MLCIGYYSVRYPVFECSMINHHSALVPAVWLNK
jgi:hypothetical protein